MPQPFMNSALDSLKKVRLPGQTQVPGSGYAYTEDEMSNPPLMAGGPRSPKDPSQLLYGLQDRAKSEAEDRLFAATRAGDPNEAAALKGLVGSYEKDIAENPITRQKAQGEQFEDVQNAARLQGFGGTMPSAEAATYGRGMEAEKMRQPLAIAEQQGQTARDVAGTERAGGLERVLATGQGNLALGAQRGQIAEESLANLRAMLSGGQIKSANLPGVGGITLQNKQSQVNPQLLKQLEVTGQAADKVGGGFMRSLNPFASATTPEANAYQQAQAAVLSQWPTSDTVRKKIAYILNSPTAMGMSTDELVQSDPTGIGAWSTEDQQDLRDALGVLRRRIF